MTHKQIREDVKRLTKINRILERTKALYKERDEITVRLSELAVTRTEKSLTIRNTLKVGRMTIKFKPTLWDEKKESVKPKTWKAGAQETLAIEIV